VDSTSAGYLTPASTPAPLFDDVLEDFLHNVIVGLTGLSGDKVRPRWQPEPPNQPDFGSDWVAFGLMSIEADVYGYQNLKVDVSYEFQRHESLEVLMSFYGSNPMKYLGLFRDGLLIDQNLDALRSVGIGQTATGVARPAPVLVKERWMKRWDLMWMFRRVVVRSYPILTLLSATGTLDTEILQTPINVAAPAP
jgi:hypothetical protein